MDDWAWTVLLRIADHLGQATNWFLTLSATLQAVFIAGVLTALIVFVLLLLVFRKKADSSISGR